MIVLNSFCIKCLGCLWPWDAPPPLITLTPCRPPHPRNTAAAPPQRLHCRNTLISDHRPSLQAVSRKSDLVFFCLRQWLSTRLKTTTPLSWSSSSRSVRISITGCLTTRTMSRRYTAKREKAAQGWWSVLTCCIVGNLWRRKKLWISMEKWGPGTRRYGNTGLSYTSKHFVHSVQIIFFQIMIYLPQMKYQPEYVMVHTRLRKRFVYISCKKVLADKQDEKRLSWE